MDIYAPIAQRLGISKIKVELDDLSLKYLEPDVYYDLVDKIAMRKSEREEYIQGIVDEVSEHIKKAGIEAKIDGRVKHFFSIYKKMKNQHKTIDQIYDLFAVRIIVDTVKDCYAALGVIHEMYKPIPGRFKDYIAMPKAEYVSVSAHDADRTAPGSPLRFRSELMRCTVWRNTVSPPTGNIKKPPTAKRLRHSEEEKLTWLRQILEWQRDMSDNKEFMSLLKERSGSVFRQRILLYADRRRQEPCLQVPHPLILPTASTAAVGNKMIGAQGQRKACERSITRSKTATAWKF